MMLRLLCVVSLVLVSACLAPPPVDPEQRRLERAQQEQERIEEQLKLGAEKLAACIASECTRLDLDGAHLADFSVLNDLPHVTKLMMSRTNFTDLADIAQMAQLKELHISWTAVNDLSGLAAFRNLELLHANNMRADPDYAPVYRMTALKELSLDGRPEDGLGFVRNMRQLETLYVISGQVRDLSPLAGNRSIKDLVLRNLQTEDETPLTQMRNLRKVDTGFRRLGEGVLKNLESRGVTTISIEAVPVC